MFLKRQEIYMGKISTYIIILAKFQHSTQKTKIHGHMILYLCACNFMIIYDQKFNLHSTLHDLISTYVTVEGRNQTLFTLSTFEKKSSKGRKLYCRASVMTKGNFD